MLKLSCTQLVSSLVIQSLLGTFTSNLFQFKQPPLSGKCLNFRSYRDKTGKLRTLVDAFRPLYPVFGMFVISTLWLLFSPNNIMTVDPRMFIMVTGTIFSNISVLFLEQMLPLEHHNNFLSLSLFSISQSRLIVAQMSDTRCDNWNSQLTVYLLAVLVCIFPFQQCGFSQLPLDVELWILWALVGIFSMLHFHYGFGIVTEMCQHFGIKCFTVKLFYYYLMFVCDTFT